MNLARRRFLFMAPAIIAAPKLMKLSALVLPVYPPLSPLPLPLPFHDIGLEQLLCELRHQVFRDAVRIMIQPSTFIVPPELSERAHKLVESVRGRRPRGGV